MKMLIISVIVVCYIGIIAAIIRNALIKKKGEDHEHL